MTSPAFWTVGEVAAHYRVCENTVYKAIKRGEFSGCRQLNGRGAIRIPQAAVRDWGCQPRCPQS